MRGVLHDSEGWGLSPRSSARWNFAVAISRRCRAQLMLFIFSLIVDESTADIGALIRKQ